MEMIRSSEEITMSVGDLVEYDGAICFLMFEEATYTKDTNEEKEISFPYMLLDMQSGRVINAFSSIEDMNNKCSLITKNKDIKLHY